MRPIFPNIQLNALQDLALFTWISSYRNQLPSTAECQKGLCKLLLNYTGQWRRQDFVTGGGK